MSLEEVFPLFSLSLHSISLTFSLMRAWGIKLYLKATSLTSFYALVSLVGVILHCLGCPPLEGLSEWTSSMGAFPLCFLSNMVEDKERASPLTLFK
jgi:hypothetical protein